MSTQDGPETPSSPLHSPDIGYKTGWTNPLMFSGGSGGGQLGAGSSSPGLSKTTANDSPLLVHRVRHKNVQQLDDVEMSNVVTMVCFATALMENLARINRGKFGLTYTSSIFIFIYICIYIFTRESARSLSLSL